MCWAMVYFFEFFFLLNIVFFKKKYQKTLFNLFSIISNKHINDPDSMRIARVVNLKKKKMKICLNYCFYSLHLWRGITCESFNLICRLCAETGYWTADPLIPISNSALCGTREPRHNLYKN